MIPVNLDDVLESLTIAQNVYKSGFRNASNPSKSLRCPCSGSLKALKIVDPSYKSFGEDIRQLAINLDLLFDVLQRALSHSGGPEKARQSPNPSFDNHILGDLKGTISTCDTLLNDQRYFQRSEGFVNNLCWYSYIEPEIAKLSERITCHNMKVVMAYVQCLAVPRRLTKSTAFHPLQYP